MLGRGTVHRTVLPTQSADRCVSRTGPVMQPTLGFHVPQDRSGKRAPTARAAQVAGQRHRVGEPDAVGEGMKVREQGPRSVPLAARPRIPTLRRTDSMRSRAIPRGLPCGFRAPRGSRPGAAVTRRPRSGPVHVRWSRTAGSLGGRLSLDRTVLPDEERGYDRPVSSAFGRPGPGSVSRSPIRLRAR
jgi:hypothetical protein